MLSRLCYPQPCGATTNKKFKARECWTLCSHLLKITEQIQLKWYELKRPRGHTETKPESQTQSYLYLMLPYELHCV